ncbi:hypothetical protein [Rhodovulum adriaticum]|uniref:DoxX-like protein n=1 Tax=Rhodovulum adriaticum TaxID=35804 RepID=A0A4R2NNB7_RHOAD|nr:hypothetical protein [Rhodovulum adriaticum]MBK1634393.1 hypothetical protein [Rhodovulum adriaticum]TCP23239.1 hypothetical protein EV656_104214 [Rhodovulum adriaticum]
MSDDTETWHLMPVAILAILWHLAGAVDYLLTQYSIAPYLVLFTQPQSSFFTALPPLADGAWATAVWGGLLGAVLLFLRSGIAPWVLGVAALAMIVLGVWLMGFATPPLADLAGPGGVALLVTATVISISFYLYARRMRVAGALGEDA